MSQSLIVGLFKEAEDAQTAINEINEAGFNTQNISLIMKNANEKVEPEEDKEDYENELDGGMEAASGLIDPISSGEFGSIEVIIPNIGDMLFAGPIASIVEEDNLEDKVTSENLPELEFDKILRSLGFSLDDATYLENYMKNNYVLIAVPFEEDEEEEINTIFSDSGAELVEKTKAEW